MKNSSVKFFLMLALCAAAFSLHAQQKTRNVVLIVTDGLRWQELFTGADPTLLNEKEGGSWLSEKDLKARYWSDDINERRKLLFPFLWSTVARDGQLIGNQTKGSVAQVTNGYAFSYPGYSEMITGHGDKRIDSNEYGLNPNLNVFEFLNKDPELKGRVAVYGTWRNFKEIFNQPRSGLKMQVGWDLPYPNSTLPREQAINQLFATTTKFDDEDLPNSLLQIPLVDYIEREKPRVLFIGYGETDNWAHSGRYDLVLDSAHQFDAFVRDLWNLTQSISEYRNQTTFLITTDHGRGGGLVEWKEHGIEEKGSENIWLAVIGPDTAPVGERTHIEPITQSQIPATIAALLGKNYRATEPAAAEPIQTLLSK